MAHYVPALSLRELPAATPFIRPPQPPYLTHLNDPAFDVMTDFHYVDPVTVSPATPIEDALDKMKRAGVRLLLVIDADAHVAGLITANDIQGEKPITFSQEQRIARSAITVGMIMTPREQVQVLSYLSVRNAQVGHVLATLHEMRAQHVLVVSEDEADGGGAICGMFSTSQINRQLHRHGDTELSPVGSLAEMVHELHGPA